MTSKSRAKGYRTVAKGRELLLAQGYIGANLEKTGKFVKDKDLFGLWDYLFIKEKEHLFIQFKTNLGVGVKKPQKWLRPYLAFGKAHGSETVRYEVWIHHDNKGFKVVKCP